MNPFNKIYLRALLTGVLASIPLYLILRERESRQEYYSNAAIKTSPELNNKEDTHSALNKRTAQEKAILAEYFKPNHKMPGNIVEIEKKCLAAPVEKYFNKPPVDLTITEDGNMGPLDCLNDNGNVSSYDDPQASDLCKKAYETIFKFNREFKDSTELMALRSKAIDNFRAWYRELKTSVNQFNSNYNPAKHGRVTPRHDIIVNNLISFLTQLQLAVQYIKILSISGMGGCGEATYRAFFNMLPNEALPQNEVSFCTVGAKYEKYEHSWFVVEPNIKKSIFTRNPDLIMYILQNMEGHLCERWGASFKRNVKDVNNPLYKSQAVELEINYINLVPNDFKTLPLILQNIFSDEYLKLMKQGTSYIQALNDFIDNVKVEEENFIVYPAPNPTSKEFDLSSPRFFSEQPNQINDEKQSQEKTFSPDL